MSKNKAIIKLTLQRYMRHLNKYGEVRCSSDRCRRLLKKDEYIVTVQNRRKMTESTTRYFCLECGDALNLVTREELEEVRKNRKFLWIPIYDDWTSGYVLVEMK